MRVQRTRETPTAEQVLSLALKGDFQKPLDLIWPDRARRTAMTSAWMGILAGLVEAHPPMAAQLRDMFVTTSLGEHMLETVQDARQVVAWAQRTREWCDSSPTQRAKTAAQNIAERLKTLDGALKELASAEGRSPASAFAALFALKQVSDEMDQAPRDFAASEFESVFGVFTALAPHRELALEGLKQALEQTIEPWLSLFAEKAARTSPTTPQLLEWAQDQLAACLYAWTDPEKRQQELQHLADTFRDLGSVMHGQWENFERRARMFEIPGWVPRLPTVPGAVQ